MIDWLAILEDDPESNPANWIDGRYVGPAAALVLRARARHEAEQKARQKALEDRIREHKLPAPGSTKGH